jgi:hypothetical protein
MTRTTATIGARVAIMGACIFVLAQILIADASSTSRLIMSWLSSVQGLYAAR